MKDWIITTTIGIDIAKGIFHLHGVNVVGGLTVWRKLRRVQVLDFFRKLDPSLVGIEACATPHHWAREISALGHEVRLMPPMRVPKPLNLTSPVVRSGSSAASKRVIPKKQNTGIVIRRWGPNRRTVTIARPGRPFPISTSHPTQSALRNRFRDFSLEQKRKPKSSADSNPV